MVGYSLTENKSLVVSLNIDAVHPHRAQRGRLPRALDGTGRKRAVRLGKIRTALIFEDGVPHNVRKFGVGTMGALLGTAA